MVIFGGQVTGRQMSGGQPSVVHSCRRPTPREREMNYMKKPPTTCHVSRLHSCCCCCHRPVVQHQSSNKSFTPAPLSSLCASIPPAYEWLGSRLVSVLDSSAEGPGFKSQSRRCRVIVLGKLLTLIKQQNWQQPSCEAWRKVMAAYRRVYDSRHLQAGLPRTGISPGTLRSVIQYELPFYDRGAEYCNERVWVCVCVRVCVCLSLRDHIFGTPRTIFAEFCARYVRPWFGPPLAQ